MTVFKSIDHLALHVPDVAAAVRFYVDTLGFEAVADLPGSTSAAKYVRLGNFMIELTVRPTAEPMSGFHFCLEAADFAEAIAALRARGVPMVKEPRPSTARAPHQRGWQRAVFSGPHGELIEVKGGAREMAQAS